MDVGDRVKMSKDFYVDVYSEPSDNASQNFELLTKIRDAEHMMRGAPEKFIFAQTPQSKEDSDSGFEIGDDSHSSSGNNTPVGNSKGSDNFSFEDEKGVGSSDKIFEKSKTASVVQRSENIPYKPSEQPLHSKKTNFIPKGEEIVQFQDKTRVEDDPRDSTDVKNLKTGVEQ